MEYHQTIISPEQLSRCLTDEKLIVLDASMPPVGGIEQPNHCWPDTVIGHAQRFDLDDEGSDHQSPYPHKMLSESDFNSLAQRLGVNDDSQVVVYDNVGIYSSARVWWMFKAMGFENVAVLDGGLPNWLRHKLPVTIKPYPNTIQGNFNGRYKPDAFVDTKYVLASLNNEKIQILDARSSARFLGEVAEPRQGVRSGHIPHSVNLPFLDVLVAGELKPVDQLKSLFSQAASTSKLVFSCGSGVTACVLALAASSIGCSNMSVYDGSWSEWGARTELPIES